MSGHAGQLAELTGLDDETIKQQILPYLATFTTKQALVNHLQDLIGPGPAQNTFIQTFADDRFPPAPATKPATPSTEAAASPSIVSPAPSKGTLGRKTKSKFPSKLPPPRKVDAASFGGVGSVYRKGQDEENLFSGPSTGTLSGKASPAIMPSPSRIESRTPDLHYSAPPQGSINAPQSTEAVANIPARAPAESGYVMMPTEEMRDVQQSIALLRGDSKEDPTVKAKPCFCQGRKHTLHPNVPLCLTCGLILCSIMSPSPLLLPSPPCPSCAAPILSTTSRAILLTQLDLTLATLTQAHENKIQLIRQERQQAWREKRKEIDLFPELHQQSDSPSSSMSSNAPGGSGMLGQAYNAFHERRRNIDIAMGRKVQDDSQRRSRVLRIESKAVKGKSSTTRKKKKEFIAKEESRQAKIGEKFVEENNEVDSDQVEEEEAEGKEEDAGLDYDHDEQGYGPIADPDDDGFAQHSSIFPREHSVESSNGHGWKRAIGFLPTVSYMSEEDRTVDVVDEEDEDEEKGTAKRLVPGSAPKEANPKQTNAHDKGKGRKTAKAES